MNPVSETTFCPWKVVSDTSFHMRSKLFVPGSRPELFAKAMASEADALSFDLEDSVDEQRKDVARADLGYIGKSAIHPSQVPIANSVFRPTDAEIAHSLKVVEAAAAAAQKGIGAYTVNARMVDGPFVRRAESVLALARKLGLIAQEGSLE